MLVAARNAAARSSRAYAVSLGDELRVFRNPVVLGRGTPFLPPGTEIVRLRLIETDTFGARVIYECYGRARGESA